LPRTVAEEWEALVPRLDDEAFMTQMEHVLKNCEYDKRRPALSYNEELYLVHAPEAVKRLREMVRVEMSLSTELDIMEARLTIVRSTLERRQVGSARVVGSTPTPRREDGESLAGAFGHFKEEAAAYRGARSEARVADDKPAIPRACGTDYGSEYPDAVEQLPSGCTSPPRITLEEACARAAVLGDLCGELETRCEALEAENEGLRRLLNQATGRGGA
jgi:hypothetical protein